MVAACGDHAGVAGRHALSGRGRPLERSEMIRSAHWSQRGPIANSAGTCTVGCSFTSAAEAATVLADHQR